MDGPAIGHSKEVSTMVDICTYCIFTLYGEVMSMISTVNLRKQSVKIYQNDQKAELQQMRKNR